MGLQHKHVHDRRFTMVKMTDERNISYLVGKIHKVHHKSVDRQPCLLPVIAFGGPDSLEKCVVGRSASSILNFFTLIGAVQG